MEFEQLQRAVEAILFAAGERVEVSRLAAVLETDESAIEIQEIYNAAAAIREIEVDELRKIVAENFARFRNPEK